MSTALYRTLTGQSQRSDHSGTSTQKIAPTPTNTSSTTDPLTGTLNHLTLKQEAALEEFKDRLEKQGWWVREVNNGKPSHDDGTLLRYLRARKFDINGAIGQFTDTEKWMKAEKVDELYEHFDVDFYEKARGMYPQWTGHRDKRGIPLYVYVIKHLDGKNVSKYQKESEAYKKSLPDHKGSSTPAKLLPLFALYQNLLHFVLPMCSTLERPNPEIPVTNSTNIVDITHVGLTQFWNLKGHMQDASVLATAHYPETLDRIFIIGAPSFFPTVWGWIKRWFDPVTVSKIFILGKHEMKATLENFIDRKDFPEQYGGTLKWDFGDLPHMDDEALQAVEKDGHKGWVPGPCMWLEHERVIVGSEKGKLRRADKEVARMKPVVYAADYTEEPVHADRKGSVAGRKSLAMENSRPIRKEKSMANGTAGAPHEETKAGVAAGGLTAATAAKLASQTKTPQTETPSVADKDVRTAPFEGSQVKVSPSPQPAHPAVTAEYLSSNEQTAAKNTATPTPQDEPEPEKLGPSSATGPTIASATIPATSTRVSNPEPIVPSSAPTNGTAVVPAGMPQPGPITDHQKQVHAAIINKMNGESVSVIPEDSGANGGLAHPEITIVSDPTKGLAVETEKLALADANGRPAIGERFHTAVEFGVEVHR